MPSQRTLRRQEARRSGKKSNKYLFKFVFTLLLVCFAAVIFYQNRPVEQVRATYTTTPEKMMELTDSLLASINPSRPANRNFPSFVTEKLHWLYSEVSAGRARISLFTDDVVSGGYYGLMHATYVDTVAAIDISIPALAHFIVKTGGTPSGGFSSAQRTEFLTALIHETIHLENKEIGSLTKENVIDEEKRAWRRTLLYVVRPLRQIGFVFSPLVEEMDSVLKGCGDAEECEDFRRRLRDMIK